MISVILGEEIRLSRDEVCARLRAAGVDTRPFFVPMSALPHLAAARTVSADADRQSSESAARTSSDRCPTSARLSARGLNLPSGCGLTREDVARVSRTLAEVVAA